MNKIVHLSSGRFRDWRSVYEVWNCWENSIRIDIETALRTFIYNNQICPLFKASISVRSVSLTPQFAFSQNALSLSLSLPLSFSLYRYYDFRWSISIHYYKTGCHLSDCRQLKFMTFNEECVTSKVIWIINTRLCMKCQLFDNWYVVKLIRNQKLYIYLF